MEHLPWILALLALLAAWSARRRASALEESLGDLRRKVSMREADEGDLARDVTFLQKACELLAKGVELDPLMIREHRLYRNAKVDALAERLASGERPYVIDVRTDQEWRSGHIPGAVHIPVDRLEKELHRVKRDGTPIHVICAGGGRSATAAEFLANRGYLDVWNVEGGMNGWRGPVDRD